MSNDGSTWETVDQRNTQDLNGQYIVKTYECSNRAGLFARFVRLRQTGPNTSNGNFLQLSEIEFFGQLKNEGIILNAFLTTRLWPRHESLRCSFPVSADDNEQRSSTSNASSQKVASSKHIQHRHRLVVDERALADSLLLLLANEHLDQGQGEERSSAWATGRDKVTVNCH